MTEEECIEMCQKINKLCRKVASAALQLESSSNGLKEAAEEGKLAACIVLDAVCLSQQGGT